jgi:hypothetical protein
MNTKNIARQNDRFLAIYFFTDGSPDFTDILGVLYPNIDTTWDIAERELASLDTLWGRVDLYRVPTELYDTDKYSIHIEHCGECIASATR